MALVTAHDAISYKVHECSEAVMHFSDAVAGLLTSIITVTIQLETSAISCKFKETFKQLSRNTAK